MTASPEDPPHPYPDRHAVGESDDNRVRHFICHSDPTHHFAADFGARLKLHAVPVFAIKTVEQWTTFVHDLAHALGMRLAQSAMVFDYPGVGFTLVQPIIESCIVLDMWDKHRAGYLMIATCGAWRPKALADIAQMHGVSLAMPLSGELRLD